MKLQKHLSQKIKGKQYVKWIVSLPPATIEKTGWKEGQKLKAEVANGNIILRNNPEPSYEEFKG